MTDDDRIERGNKAEALLSREFEELYELAREEIANEIVSSGYDDVSGRERSYCTYQGMHAFKSKLQLWVSSRNKIIEAREDASDEFVSILTPSV